MLKAGLGGCSVSSVGLHAFAAAHEDMSGIPRRRFFICCCRLQSTQKCDFTRLCYHPRPHRLSTPLDTVCLGDICHPPPQPSRRGPLTNPTTTLS